MIAALLTLAAAAILFGGGSNLAFEGDRLSVRCAGIAMMSAGVLAFVGAFLLALQ